MQKINIRKIFIVENFFFHSQVSFDFNFERIYKMIVYVLVRSFNCQGH